jgi:hypothetical protein
LIICHKITEREKLKDIRDFVAAERIAWCLVLLTLVFTAIIRYRLLGVPLERDEGEYAYAAQLMLQGIPPYRELYAMKLPGIYAAYALLLSVFGQTHQGIHAGLLVVKYPAHRAGHLKTILAASETSLVHDDT